MATKLIIICDWHNGEDIPAIHHNRWKNPQGKHKKNDLCAEHQAAFLAKWDELELNSEPDEETPARPATRRRRAKDGPGDQALIKAWARSAGITVSDTGRAAFNVEQAWKDAGSPNLLEKS